MYLVTWSHTKRPWNISPLSRWDSFIKSTKRLMLWLTGYVVRLTFMKLLFTDSHIVLIHSSECIHAFSHATIKTVSMRSSWSVINCYLVRNVLQKCLFRKLKLLDRSKTLSTSWSWWCNVNLTINWCIFNYWTIHQLGDRLTTCMKIQNMAYWC